jgi:hypothetical protein
MLSFLDKIRLLSIKDVDFVHHLSQQSVPLFALEHHGLGIGLIDDATLFLLILWQSLDGEFLRISI